MFDQRHFASYHWHVTGAHYQGNDEPIPEFAGQAIADMISARMPKDEPWNICIWLMRLKGSPLWHWMFLDSAGFAVVDELSEADVNDSLDDDFILTQSPFAEVWRGAKIASAEIISMKGYPKWPLPALQFHFENGYTLSLCFDYLHPDSGNRIVLTKSGTQLSRETSPLQS